MPKTPPTQLDRKLATLLIGVDTLFEGDALHESGRFHSIADTWFSGLLPPEIYNDPFARAARDYAQKKKTTNVLEDIPEVKNFVAAYGLKELATEIRRDANLLPPDEKTYVQNLANALNVMLRTILSKTGWNPEPSFDEKYLAATGGTVSKVELIDPTEAQELLRQTLSHVGYETSGRTLRETFFAWENAQTNLTPQQLHEQSEVITSKLLYEMREGVFNFLQFPSQPKCYEPNLSDIAFDGHRFDIINNVDFTGSSIYQGKEEGGKPTFNGLFEYNSDHPINTIGLIHLCAHEVIGHYINSAVKDLLWRAGKIGFLATMGTMATPETVFQEGWAQNMFEILYGSRENAADAHGKDLFVALAHADLEDIGKHNVSILFQREKNGVDQIKRYIADVCIQTDAIVKKLSGGWAQSPINGPMYSPAYFQGRKIVNGAIKLHGHLPVARIGYHLDGLVDIKVFQDKVSRLSV